MLGNRIHLNVARAFDWIDEARTPQLWLKLAGVTLNLDTVAEHSAHATAKAMKVQGQADPFNFEAKGKT